MNLITLQCRDNVLQKYEALPEHDRPFAAPADKEHLSDDESDDSQRLDTQEPAHQGSSNKESHTSKNHAGHGHKLTEGIQGSPRAGQKASKADKKNRKGPDYVSAEKRDSGAHTAPSATQEMQHDHAQFDDDTCMRDQRDKHAFKKQ